MSPLERGLSDPLIFVPHTLGDTGLRKTKGETMTGAPGPVVGKLCVGVTSPFVLS